MQVTTSATTAVAPVEGTATETSQSPEAAPEVPKEKDNFAEKFEMLSKRERSIYRENQRLAMEKQQLAQERAEYEKFKSIKANAKKNPMDYINEGGLSYDDLTQWVLNGGKATEKNELQEVRDEFNKFRQSQEEKEKKLLEQQSLAQKQAEAQAIEGFKEQITEFVESNKTTYELSSMRDATDDIFTTINDAYVISMNEWHKNGRVGRPPGPMAIKDAADIVEEFYEKEVLRLAETSKMKARFQPQSQQEASQKAKEPSKTLMNNMASTAASVVPSKNDHDRMRRALEKLG